MKRNIIFIITLFSLLLTIVTVEKTYTNNFRNITNKTIGQCNDSDNSSDFIECANQLFQIMSKRKFTNRLFFSKDITEQIINETKKLKVYATENELSDAKASVENLKFLFKSLYRFNEKSE